MLEETVAASIAQAGVSADASPDRRLGEGVAAGDAELEEMLRSLLPLPVADSEDGEGDLAIVGRLGEGGMGVVELARQTTLDREVALKRLRDSPPPGSRESAVRAYNLLDEARINGRLEHPNIVPVHAIGHDAKLGPVVLFKRVHGEVWHDVLRRDADALPGDSEVLETHLRILLQVGNALRYAHSRGVLHRDVKPANVMVGPFGEVYLLDWGLALQLDGPRASVAAVAGTATFMAPEMARGELEALGPWSDVYLLGATLHAILTGTPRHRSSTLAACLLSAIISEPVEYGPETPAELAAIANRACARDPAHRFESVEAFQQAIEDYLSQREALLLLDSAREAIAPIVAEDRGQQSTGHAVRDRVAVTRRFLEARFAIAQALRLRPGLAVAVREQRELLQLMIRHALARGEVAEALALREELDVPLAPELEKLIEATREARRSRRKRLESLERDADESISQTERLRAVAGVFVAITLGQALRWWFHPGPGFDIGPAWLLGEVALLAVVVVGVLAVWRRRFRSTRLNRQFARMLVAAVAAVGASRGIGLMVELSPPLILMLELVMVSMIFLVAELPLRAGPWVAGLGFVGAAFGVWLPSQGRLLHDLFLELVVLLVLVDLLHERRRVRAERAARSREAGPAARSSSVPIDV